MRRAVEKVLHAPTVRVKELATTPGGDQYAAALRELFDLDPAAAESVAAVEPRRAGGRMTDPWLAGARMLRPASASAPGAAASPAPRPISSSTRSAAPRRDRSRSSPRATARRSRSTQIGGTGVFVSALRDALLAGEIDVAVHSYKDLPTAAGRRHRHRRGAARARTRATRSSPATGSPSASCRPGARVGTGSPRRAAQLRALGLGSTIVPIRGNVDTRLGKVGEATSTRSCSPWPACAGSAAPTRSPRSSTRSRCCRRRRRARWRSSAAPTTAAPRGLLAALDDADTRAAVTAERALLAALEAGCSAPVGALAEIATATTDLEVFLRGSVTAVDGSDAVRLSATGRGNRCRGWAGGLPPSCSLDGADKMMGSST